MDFLSDDELGEILSSMTFGEIQNLRLTDKLTRDYIDKSKYFCRLVTRDFGPPETKDCRMEYKKKYTEENEYIFLEAIDEDDIVHVEEYLLNGFIPGHTVLEIIHSKEMLDLLVDYGVYQTNSIQGLTGMDPYMVDLFVAYNVIPKKLISGKIQELERLLKHNSFLQSRFNSIQEEDVKTDIDFYSELLERYD